MAQSTMLQEKLTLYQNEIENIANQLCLAVKGEFSFAIKIDSDNESVQKLCMLINFVIDAANRALKSIEEKNLKLTELDKLKSDFLANVSHELRTPLTLILGPIEALIRDLDSISPQHRESLQFIQRNANRLYFLVNDILDFSKLEAGKFKVNLESVDLNTLISQIVEDAKGMAKERKLTLEFTPCSDLGLLLLDQKMIETIAINLIGNALKFTLENGSIKVQLKKQKDKVELSVSDTGIGIPLSHLHKLFERFHQVDTSLTRPYEGTGIGLALVNHFTKLLGGNIQVESEEGKGSSFTVTLPMHRANRDPSKLPSGIVVKPSLKTIKSSLSLGPQNKKNQALMSHDRKLEGKLPLIVIADDNDDMRAYLISLLEDNYEIISAADGIAALELIRQYHPQVILSDVMMPKMDGYQLTKEIKSDPSIQHIPIILITAKTGNESLVSGLNVGADDYLSKPFTTEELKARLGSALRNYQSYLKLIDLNNQLNIANRKLEKSNADLAKANQEIQKNQLQLIQQSKLASIGQLAAGVAHEINNPISFIKSNTEILQDYFTDLKEIFHVGETIIKMINIDMCAELYQAKQRWEELYVQHGIADILEETPELITESISGLKRVTSIVEDLSTFAYSKQEKMELADINKCLDSTLKIIYPELKYRCQLKKQYENLPLIACYPRQLNQVFANILINAYQAIQDKGEISISTKSLNNEIMINISDSGQGIAPEYMDKLFDPFFTTKPPGVGTGLGLSISNNVVKKHGGRIEVKSKKHKGSSFTIYLPVSTEPSNSTLKVD